MIAPSLQLDTLSSNGLLDALPDGAYLTDRNRRIIFWNSAAERITGWNREEVVGRNCSDNILVHIDKDGHQLCSNTTCPLHRAMENGMTSEEPLLLFAQSKSGRRIPVEVSVAPVRDDEGEVIGGVEIFRDMTLMMRDLSRAREIQKQSLQFTPIKDPRLQIAELYTPHDLIGGDFLHVEVIDADHYAVFLADVTGHGVAAALYTMQLRSLCEEHRDKFGSPSEFMSALNTRLHTLGNQNDYFATATHFVVNAATGGVVYACAGHESPLLVQPDSIIIQLNHKDPCLGLIPDTHFHSNRTQLAANASLLLFTDGAIEINNADGIELGIDGFCSILNEQDFHDPVAALAQIETKLLDYSTHLRLPDDMTLLCIHRS
ncbi:MAG: hypothetical protein B9S32_14995 [Verrucomicrobia bacterium Tous-C9LFEB]|nr:MAG: hypothetical protein B9S32_14995 [Verrucomicrobia bacterium Tous-C9LFEB]